jgi:hypothetical protein
MTYPEVELRIVIRNVQETELLVLTLLADFASVSKSVFLSAVWSPS